MVTAQQHRICFVINLIRIPCVLRTGLFRASAALLNGYYFWAAGIVMLLVNGYKP